MAAELSFETSKQPSAAELSPDVIIHYLDVAGTETERRVTVKGLGEGGDTLKGWCHLRAMPREFTLSRIQSIADAETGEIIGDLATWMEPRAAILAARHHVGLPREARETRTLPTVRFSNGLAEGWAFSVPEAFKAALDILTTARVISDRSNLPRELSERGVPVPPAVLQGDRRAIAHLFHEVREAGIGLQEITAEPGPKGQPRIVAQIETQGSPPACSFEPGDVFYSPPEARMLAWGEALNILQHVIQVASATVARPAAPIAPASRGEVVYDLRTYEGGKVVDVTRRQCTQVEFAAILRDGVLLVTRDHGVQSKIVADTP